MMFNNPSPSAKKNSFQFWHVLLSYVLTRTDTNMQGFFTFRGLQERTEGMENRAVRDHQEPQVPSECLGPKEIRYVYTDQSDLITQP